MHFIAHQDLRALIRYLATVSLVCNMLYIESLSHMDMQLVDFVLSRAIPMKIKL